jgi:hypothetical protein
MDDVLEYLHGRHLQQWRDRLPNLHSACNVYQHVEHNDKRMSERSNRLYYVDVLDE